MGLSDELATIGFAPVEQDRRGMLRYARTPNRFLTEWVHDLGDELLFTWEFEMGEYCAAVGWQLGSAETSFQILYPQYDVKIARDLDAIAAEVQRLEEQLRCLDLADPAL